MHDFPQELVFVLIFGAVWLAQLLYRWLRRGVAALPQETESETETRAETNMQIPPAHMKAEPRPLPARAAEVLEPVLMSRPAAVAQAARALPPAGSRARRFSRVALMPDRRAVQDAVVIAAILQPCHAQRSHDTG